MKKYILVLFLTTLLVPQVVFAAWWNPFSWKVFHKEENKTQVLENRIKELEKKIDTQASTTKTGVEGIYSSATTTVDATKTNKRIITKPNVKISEDTKEELRKEIKTFVLPSGAIVDMNGRIFNVEEMEKKIQESLEIEALKIKQQTLDRANRELEQKLLDITLAQVKEKEETQRQSQIDALKLERDNLIRPLVDEIHYFQGKIRNASSNVKTEPSYDYNTRVSQFKVDTQKQVDEYVSKIRSLEEKYNGEIVKLGGGNFKRNRL